METLTKFDSVKTETMKAYYDCHGDHSFEDSMNIRDLGFKANASVSPTEAVEIMLAACPRGYNLFNADLLLHFPKRCEITLARERSVCVYVKANGSRLPSAEILNADEYGFNNGVLRVWWD